MVAIKAHEVEARLTRLDPVIRVVLLYGPDHGLVVERSEALARAAVGDVSDPFRYVRLDGADVAADPMRLVDEANTIGLFGGQRAIRVSATSRSLASAVEPLLQTPPVDALVILEAGELARNHALRVMVERARCGLAAPCYNDQAGAIDTLIERVLKEHGLGIDREARALLQSRLGADRQLSRREIEKLALYAFGQGSVTIDDIDAIVGDASARQFDDVVDGVFCGTLPRIDQGFARLASSGEDMAVLLGFVIRHALALMKALQASEQGGVTRPPAADAVQGFNYTRKSDIETALRRWSRHDLGRAVSILGTAALQARRQQKLSNELAMRALWNVAMLPSRA
jgi:DNA polymerase III subunit delta